MADTPDNGQVVETTTRRRIIAASKAGPPPNFWEYLAALTPADWSNHLLYLYRDDPPPSIQVAKCSTPILEGTNTPWSDQEEMEASLAQKFGGGQYRIMVKRGSERVCYGKLLIPGPSKNLMPRMSEPNTYGPGPQVQPSNGYGGGGYYGGDTARVAETAIHTMANQEKQAVEIGISALAQAANVIKNFSATPPPGPADDMQRAFMAAMIQRMTQPQPDLIEQITRILPLVQPLMSLFAARGSAGDPLLGKVMEAAIEKILNPAPTGPVSSAGAELVRQLPTIAGAVTQGITEWRMGMEAQKEMVLAGARSQPTAQVQPIRPPQPQLIPPAANPQPPANGASNMPGVEFIEGKIVEILRKPTTPDEAAQEVVDFLDVMDGSLVDQLASLGEPGLLNLFSTRPTLRPAIPASPTDNRLKDFVRAFLKYASDNGTEVEAGAKPN